MKLNWDANAKVIRVIVGAFSVIVKLCVIFGNLRFKLYSAATSQGQKELLQP